MNVSAERSKAIWGPLNVEAEPLRFDTEAEVVVVGSGMAGMSVAYELAAAGKDVAVVDRGPVGGGMTSRTTAHLSSYSDDGFRELIDIRGLEIAKGWQQSQAAAISRIESIQNKIGAACDFRRIDAFLFLAPETDPAVIERELLASAQVGMLAYRHEGTPFVGYQTAPALRFPEQATFHPLKYLAALAGAIRQAGGRFYSETPIVSVEESASGVEVTTMSGLHIRADSAVVATNSPINDRVAISSKQAPYRTYAAAFEIPGGTIPDALFWDTLDPYHYVRLQTGANGADVLIVGGEDHKTGGSNDGEMRIRSLEQWMRALAPNLGREVARWSGQVLEPIDYAAFIGKSPGHDRIYVATGDSGQGITHGAVAGMLIRDLILHGGSPWSEIYDPNRKPLKAATEFISENATAVKSYAGYLTPGDLDSTDKLPSGEGAIIRRGLHKIAAYRDDDGGLHEFAASCTHVGCLLRWNSFERCWDCPCHGSQFAADGEALNAPAFSPLSKSEG